MGVARSETGLDVARSETGLGVARSETGHSEWCPSSFVVKQTVQERR
jgi:hypothetical protein